MSATSVTCSKRAPSTVLTCASAAIGDRIVKTIARATSSDNFFMQPILSYFRMCRNPGTAFPALFRFTSLVSFHRRARSSHGSPRFPSLVYKYIRRNASNIVINFVHVVSLCLCAPSAPESDPGRPVPPSARQSPARTGQASPGGIGRGCHSGLDGAAGLD